jgi:uncharacterized circularly permuted ATP-grasp superfamily protein/uncharacterized alpha-E superfamily protein
VSTETPVPRAIRGFRDLIRGYAVPAGHYDEVRDPHGGLRPQWESFVAQAGQLGAEDLTRAQDLIARQIHENGVTYHVYAAPGGPTRPWVLDPLPLILSPEEWAPLERALRQRARLLERLAADVYGPQELLASGEVPAALVLGNPGFLRPAHGVMPPGGTFLHVIAFDLGRGPDGDWRVVGTRVQAPSGSGYALANRLIVSRLLRDAFRDLHVHMLAPFFRALQLSLRDAAPADGDAPHVVLLSPGPYNETYYEHASVARYLGLTLVEGADLTVRDNRVYLKTVTGLRRVHAILRRLDDDFCDPLELRPDSTLGVPGLLQAWRAGNVLVANAFGAGALETPALYGFLPPLCERLLGEPLELPSIPTWWAGESAALEEAASRLGEMVVKPAFPDLAMEPRFLGRLDAAARERTIEQVRLSPERYILQSYLPLSHAPVWRGGRLESRAVMLRAALVSDGRGDYCALPGGLTRSSGEDAQVVSSQRGGSSKETWVLSRAPVERLSLMPGRLAPGDVVHKQTVVSSRAAEHLFWHGRYAERTQNGARLLRSVLARLPDSDYYGPGFCEAAVRTCIRHGALEGLPRDYAGAGHQLEDDLVAGVYDAVGRRSLAFNVEQTVRAAGTVRERLSPDNWRLLNRLRAVGARPGPFDGLSQALERIDQTIVALVAVTGLEMSHMTRDDGWRFLEVGRLLERLLFAVSAVDQACAVEDPRDAAVLDWLLDLFDKTSSYRARFLGPTEWLPAMDLLVLDTRNPRSVAFQLEKLIGQVELLPGADLSEPLERLRGAAATCRGAGRPRLLGDARAMRELLASCADTATRFSDAVNVLYFSHAEEASAVL